MCKALWALIVSLAISPLAAQQPIVPPPQPPPAPAARGRSTQHAVVVKGCVRNGRLRSADAAAGDLTFTTLNVSEFVLEGPKELLQQITELHNGHYDEIAGVATVPPPPQDEDAAVVTSKKGPVTITAGRRDEKSFGARNAPQPIKLRVASLTHISEGCAERR
jgi:hypothetical protein